MGVSMLTTASVVPVAKREKRGFAVDRILDRRELFLNEMGKLCADVEAWLAPQTARALLTVLHDSLGEYEAPALVLEKKGFSLRIVPIGWVTSLHGKAILMVCGKSRSLFLREDGWNIGEISEGRYVFTRLDTTLLASWMRNSGIKQEGGGISWEE